MFWSLGLRGSSGTAPIPTLYFLLRLFSYFLSSLLSLCCVKILNRRDLRNSGSVLAHSLMVQLAMVGEEGVRRECEADRRSHFICSWEAEGGERWYSVCSLLFIQPVNQSIFNQTDNEDQPDDLQMTILCFSVLALEETALWSPPNPVMRSHLGEKDPLVSVAMATATHLISCLTCAW